MIIPLNTETINTTKLIEYIHEFELSTSFFRWFAGNDLVIHTSFETKSAEAFERYADYYLYDLMVFSGGGEFSLQKMNPSFSQAANEPYQYYSMLPELSKLKKRKISDILVDSKYTVVSQFFYLDQVCGTCWEIYHMENLEKAYKIRSQRASSVITGQAILQE